MPGLTQKDLEILRHYAGKDNRELYWNYLAQLPDSDGYGLLALGVVRNDNAPGQVANAHAQAFARRNGVELDERGWEQFGIDLMKRDFAMRQFHFKDDPTRALNLKGEDVKDVHDDSFRNANIDPDAWTPRRLMNMAEDKGGPPAMEHVWSNMLDNRRLGLDRAWFTSAEVWKHTDLRSLDSVKASVEYMGDMTVARMAATQNLANTDPDTIGIRDFHYRYDRNRNAWSEVQELHDPGSYPHTVTRTVTDPDRLRQLSDTRELRLEREEKRQQFHPDDPYREIARSPQTLAGNEQPSHHEIERLAMRPASGGQTAPAQFSDPSHPDHALHLNVRQALYSQLPDGAVVSEDRLAQFTLAAKEARIRPDEMLDVRFNESSATLQGHHPAHGARVDLAAPPPTAQDSARQAAELDQQRQEQAQQRQLAAQQQAQAGPALSLGG